MQREEEARLLQLGYMVLNYVGDCYFFGVPFKLISPSQSENTLFDYFDCFITPDFYQFRAT